MPYKSRWSVPIPDCSLPTLLFTSATHTESPSVASKPAYIDAANPETDFFTRQSFKLWCQRFALGLNRLPGFKAGERVLIFSANNLAVPVAFMGVIMAGGIYTGANPTFTARELSNQLKDSDPAYLLCSEGSLETSIEAAKIAGISRDKIRYIDADLLFRKGHENKPDIKGVRYWSDVFAKESESRSYQWPELKGESAR